MKYSVRGSTLLLLLEFILYILYHEIHNCGVSINKLLAHPAVLLYIQSGCTRAPGVRTQVGVMSHGICGCLYVLINKCLIGSSCVRISTAYWIGWCVFLCRVNVLYACVHACVCKWPRQELVKVNWALDWTVDKGGGLLLHLGLPGVRRCPICTQRGVCVCFGIRNQVFLWNKWRPSPTPSSFLHHHCGI